MGDCPGEYIFVPPHIRTVIIKVLAWMGGWVWENWLWRGFGVSGGLVVFCVCVCVCVCIGVCVCEYYETTWGCGVVSCVCVCVCVCVCYLGVWCGVVCGCVCVCVCVFVCSAFTNLR